MIAVSMWRELIDLSSIEDVKIIMILKEQFFLMFWRLTTAISTLLKLINFTWLFTSNWSCWSIFFMNIAKIWSFCCLTSKSKDFALTLWIEKDCSFGFDRRRDKIRIFFENLNTFKSAVADLKIVASFNNSILIDEITWEKIKLSFFMFSNKSHWFIHNLLKMISWSSRSAMNIETINCLCSSIRILR